MSRVFVIEETHKDLEQASQYGSIEYLFDHRDTRPSIWETPDFMSAVLEKLKSAQFNEDDYVLCVGGIVPLMLTMVLLSRVFPKFRVLFWHAVVREYVPRTFQKSDFHETAV